MEALYCEPIDLSPGILLDKNSEKFKIFGISCPSNPFEIYDPVIKWFDEYLLSPLDKTVLDLNLTYFNTSSAKFIYMIMAKLDNLVSSGYNINIRWFYSEGDYDMKEEGEEFEDLLDIDFEFIPVKNGTNDLDDDEYYESILNETF